VNVNASGKDYAFDQASVWPPLASFDSTWKTFAGASSRADGFDAGIGRHAEGFLPEPTAVRMGFVGTVHRADAVCWLSSP
jgi:hypothetical protein